MERAADEIARFATAKSLSQILLPILLALTVASLSVWFAAAILGSDTLTLRSRLGLPLLLGLFAVAVVVVFGRKVPDALPTGVSISISDGCLRAFTVDFAELPLSEIADVRLTGQRGATKMIIYDHEGPRLEISVHRMTPDPATIARSIRMAALGSSATTHIGVSCS